LHADTQQALGTPAPARWIANADTSMFAHSNECLACHNNLITESGEDVSIGANWRGTMMANAARDPYVQASVRRETMDHPRRYGRRHGDGRR
jgi:hypothetical protein